MTNYHDEEDPEQYRVDAALWRRILVHAKPFRRSIAGLISCGAILAAANVGLPLLTGAVINDAMSNQGHRLWPYAVLYLSVVIFMAVLVMQFINLAGALATGVAYNLRSAGFAHLQRLSFSYYDHRPVGWLMARMTSDCDRISSILPWAVLDGVWGSLFMSGIACVMLWMNWRLAIVVLCIVPPLALATAIYQKRLVRSQRRARSVNSKITAGFNEGITGVRTTKAFVREEQNLAEFQVHTQEMFGHSARNAMYGAVYLPIVISLGATGVALAIWRGGLLALGGSLPFGDLVVFMQYAGLFHIPIQEMAERFTGLQEAQVSAERLQSLLDAEPEIQDSSEVRQAMAGSRDGIMGDRDLLAIDGHDAKIREITFEAVHFSYKEGGPVLTDFNLKIGAGESVALVGETGSGKSTVAKLLSRFYEPTQGAVRVNGVDYRQRSLHWLQSNLGMVLQEPHLFSGSILENIRYGRLDATDAEVKAVARSVGAQAFVEKFPDRYATDVGEGGNRLSTGQKQLIALARALLADPQILILDEATSSVDTETEREIQAAIEAVLKGRISLIIAHRLSTIRTASRILVLDHGRIVEQGTHSDLLQLAGPYARLYSQQFRVQHA
jgi:ATP-binding cassette, subfamily B, bacterial